MMFPFNSPGPAEYGMVAELHRQVRRATEREDGPESEARPRLFTRPFRLLVTMWGALAHLRPRPAPFKEDPCSPAESC
ncbi:MAG: hypothetical protein KJ063_07785 [Anaerolineae bacterium]|nr:hypothetical protein [Anaerolineae bacterium]